MSWISDILGGSLGGIVGEVGNLIDGISTTDEERADAKHKLQALLQQRESEIETTIRRELAAKERVLVAELQQGDSFTKRARPSVVYVGLLFIFLNYVVFPAIAYFTGGDMLSLELPTEFWVAWGGIVGTWAIGRSVEKRGASNKFSRLVTGNKSSSILDS